MSRNTILLKLYSQEEMISKICRISPPPSVQKHSFIPIFMYLFTHLEKKKDQEWNHYDDISNCTDLPQCSQIPQNQNMSNTQLLNTSALTLLPTSTLTWQSQALSADITQGLFLACQVLVMRRENWSIKVGAVWGILALPDSKKARHETPGSYFLGTKLHRQQKGWGA